MPHLSEEQARALVRRFGAEMKHLEECPDCRAHFKELISQEDGGYRAALTRATEHTLRRIPGVNAEKAAAPELLAELLQTSESEREALVALDPRFHSYALAAYILKQCETTVPRDPDLGRALARLARVVAEQVDPRSCGGAATLADLGAYAFALEADSLRIAGEAERALRAFAEARRLQERGGADPDVGARVDLLEAALRRELGEPAVALDLLDRAAAAFVMLREHDQLARALLLRLRLSGERDRGVGSLGRMSLRGASARSH